MSPPRVLLTGATGYIGGTVLHQLVSSTHPALQEIPVTVLVRGEERAAKLKDTYGERVTCVQFDSFDNTELLAEKASQHDVVVNAFGFHPGSAEALVRGLAAGRAGEGAPASPAWMIHTSGCSNIADKPLTGESHPEREWHDADAEAVYAFEKAENARSWYPQRAAELGALDASLETGGRVRALSVQIPNICGTGEGQFQNASLIIPIMMGWVLEKGWGFYLGDGTAAIDHVHVSDLAALYVLLVRRIAEDGGDAEPPLPRGRAGILFPTNGRTRLYDVAARCLDAAFEAGALPLPGGASPPTKEVRQISLEEAAATTAGDATVAEMGWSAHRLTNGTVARRLGWDPRRGEAECAQDYLDELRAALAGKRGITIDNCIDVRGFDKGGK